MANKIDLQLTLNTELGRVSKDIEKLKGAGAFSGEKGSKQLNAISGMLDKLKATDVSKLKGPELTNFINQIYKLRQYLDTAAKGLTNFSTEYEQALKKVTEATDKATKIQDKLTAATERQKNALKKSKEAIASSGYDFYQKSTGAKIGSNRYKQINDLYNNQDLIIKSGNKNITGLQGVPERLGLIELSKSAQEVADFTKDLNAADEELKNLTKTLQSTPTGGDVHPVTSEVMTGSAAARENLSQLKEGIIAENKNQIAELEQVNVGLEKQSSSLGKAFKQFTIYAIALRAVKKALHEAVATVKELDRALTEQAMVTSLSREQTYGLLSQYQDMASRLGATTKEVSSTMTQFLRQGRSVTDSLKLTEAAVSAAKIAGISTAESINYLTTAINGFRLSANDAMKVSDKFAAVAATAAVSYEEIATALSKVAAQANLAGMSIDYTTALLTKGIETTREAPETIGTALKTVIARMRELGDYGETLAGDENINNVEAQLSYIGIQLRDNQGELRSTEDVLDELGAQWDQLNANQQAAIAKALAGTRQQSRLIAMMQDYERVTELQEIALRSEGATMAQMATYMEGMDAALNKVNVAWEKIVSNLVESEFLINIINQFSDFLDQLGNFLKTDFGTVTTLTTISALGLIILSNKIKENAIAKQQQLTQIAIQKIELKRNKIQAEAFIQGNKSRILDEKRLLLENKITIQKLTQAKTQRQLSPEETASLAKAEEFVKNNESRILQEEAQLKTAELTVNTYQAQNDMLTAQEGLIGKISSGISALTAPLFLVITLWKTISGLITMVSSKQRKLHAQTVREETTENSLRATGAAGKIIEQLGVYGIPIGIAVAAALAGIALAISYAKGSTKSTEEKINDASAAIYDLNKKATALNSTISKFEALDNKIIKTNADLEEMNTLLESAGDSLSEEEQKIYKGLSTNAGRLSYLKSVADVTRGELSSKRHEQRNLILGADKDTFLNSQEGDWVQARDAIYALNNAELYRIIDNTKNLNKATEKLTQTLLEELSAEEALAVLRNQSVIANYAQSVSDGADAFLDEDKSIKERMEAYKQLRDSINKDLLPALKEAYSDWETLSHFSQSTIDFMDAIGASTDDVNELGKAMQDLGIAAEDTTAYFEWMIHDIEQIGLSAALENVFGKNGQEMLKAYEKVFGTTLLNIGQNMDKFTNKIDSFYSKAADWSTMSETDRTQFISENGAMFEGEAGQKLLQAFYSGDYTQIANALANNPALQQERELLLQNLEIQLEIEEARDAASRNQAYIDQLKKYKAQLLDTENLYLASLETRLQQQNAQLDAYKEYLQKENDALTDSLNKRKEAYQKYFDAINQEADKQEYEEKTQMLIANISKLGSSTNADAIAKTADLTKQLEELEKERLQTLREQAQEKVIQGIEDEVTQISDNLEKLLNNEQALLMAMTSDATSNPSQLIASMMAAQAASGNNTELGMESYLQQLESTFAMLMPGVDWSDIDVTREGDSLILNIAGQGPIDLTSGEQQTIYDAIYQALRQIGKN